MATIIKPLDTQIEQAGGIGKRRYVSKYRVITDNEVAPGEAMLMVQNNSTGDSPNCLPGDEYIWEGFTDPWASAMRVAPTKLAHPKWKDKQNGSDRVFIVSVIHQMNDPERCQDQSVDNPILEPWQVSISDQTYEVTDAIDRFGNPILTTSFESVTVRNFRSRRHYRLMKNYMILNEGFNAAARTKVNKFAITVCNRTWAPRTLFLESLDVTRKNYGHCNYYYPHTFSLVEHADPKIVNEGKRQLHPDLDATDPANRLPENMVNVQHDKGADTRKNVLLDPNGVPVKGAPPAIYLLDNTGGSFASAAIGGTLQVLDEIDFAPFGFPAII